MQEFPEYEPFRHGLVVSKIWLCEELEKVFNKLKYNNPTIHVLAGWHNLLSFMMIVRKPIYYNKFYNYDINQNFILAANKLCETWTIEDPKVENIHTDINVFTDYRLTNENVFINCSTDQIDGIAWYDNIPKGSLVCLQTTNLDILGHPWYIKTVTKNCNDFKNKFVMSQVLFCDEKIIDYDTWGYNRLMIIGIK